MIIHITLDTGKAEYIFSFLISLSMIIISIKLFIDSITSIVNKNKLEFSFWLIIVCIITIITKLFLYIYTKILYKKYNNILLRANYKDHRNDCIVTSFTLISVLLTLINVFWFDGIVGIGISIWIFYTGLTILVESYNVLMDISIDENTKNTILELSKKYTEIKSISDLYSTPSGYKYVIILTISVDGNLSTFESHTLADNLEKDILKIDKVSNAIIHVNPV